MANDTYAISIAELVVYVILFPLAIFVASRHGFGKSSGWVYLAIFTAIRIASSALGIASYHNPTNQNDLVWYSILAGIGISPLLLASKGLLSRVNESCQSSLRIRIIHALSIPNLLALVLSIVGGTRLNSSNASTQSQGKHLTQAGIIIFLVVFVFICAIAMLTWTSIGSIPDGEKRIFFAVLSALPFIFVRILYSILTHFLDDSTFTVLNGSATAQLCMATIEEIVVTILYIAVGLTTSSLKGDRGSKQLRACINTDDGIMMVYDLHSNQNSATQGLSQQNCQGDHAKPVRYCLENGAQVTDDMMKLVLLNRAKETYTLLLDSKAIDVDYYIPWFGDILGNVATDDDRKWTPLCLSRGADPNKNLIDEHKSLLAAVAELASVETAKLLVEEGGATVRGSGAIVMAAEEGKLDMVKFLLDHDADINEIGIEHPTDERYKEDMGSALHKAAEGGHEDVDRFLINNGAMLDIKDPLGRAPMALVQTKGKDKMVELLRTDGAAK
ncbi:MAG: hypothetical protein Q9181_005916 [Wetmoreana brouardii]